MSYIKLTSNKVVFLESPNKRRLHLDILRVAAICFVVFNHTGEFGYLRFSITTNSILQVVYLSLSLLCKIAVPIFYMVFGALLLNKEESYSVVFKKRVSKYLMVLALISLFYWLYDMLVAIKTGGDVVSFTQFVEAVYSRCYSLPLWYLYSYISYLMMLPLLRKLVKQLKHRDYVYIFLLTIFFDGCIPIFENLFFQNRIHIYGGIKGALFTSTNIIYPLFGYWIEYVLPDKYRNKSTVFVGGGICSCAVLVCMFLLLFVDGGLLQTAPQAFHGCFMALFSVTVYLAVKLFSDNTVIPLRVSRIITSFSTMSFGTYLFETIIRNSTMFLVEELRVYTGTMPATLIWVLSVILLGYATTYCFRKIPMLKVLL